MWNAFVRRHVVIGVLSAHLTDHCNEVLFSTRSRSDSKLFGHEEPFNPFGFDSPPLGAFCLQCFLIPRPLAAGQFIKALRWIPPSSAGGRKAEIRRRRIMLLVWSK